MDKKFLKNITVLYVEDELDVLHLTTDILARFVHRVIPAQNGQEGLELFKKHNLDSDQDEDFIDIIVTDINMPKMNGLDMIEAIHKLDYSIPSVITTAHTDSSFLKKAINLRVRGYVNKPLNIDSLIDTIAYASEPKFLKEQLLQFNKELRDKVEEKTLELRYILDSQENMILVFDEQNISSANRTFLDFFGFQSIENLKDYQRFSDLFLEEKGCFIAKEEDWVGEIVKLEDKKGW